MSDTKSLLDEQRQVLREKKRLKKKAVRLHGRSVHWKGSRLIFSDTGERVPNTPTLRKVQVDTPRSALVTSMRGIR